MELFYREYGEGIPVIILHGLLGISDNWVGFSRRLAEEGFKVFIPDQRNHGQSPQHPVLNYYALVDDLSEFIESHHLIKPIILGHSMGGKVAMRYTLEHPGSVDRLIVVDTSLRTYVRFNYHLKLIDAMLSVDFNHTGSRQEVEDRLYEKIKDDRLVQFLMKNLFWKEKGKLGWRPNLQAISYHVDSMYDGVFYSTKFDKPVLFVRGGKSDYILEEDIPAIYQNFPHAIIKTLENGTHWVHADEPEEFYKLVTEFLKS
ncbi:MAG: alpha/beta fold hydrolase [Bacteroidales bacterium]|nr:alpha/beta fold hydrolase [Bacteroidales bacterium]